MKIKICGLKNLKQAQCAADCGADFAGLIFAENSPRKIEFKEAEKIAKNLKGKVKLVGVFQNQPLEFILEISEKLGLFAIQLHGREDAEFALELAKKAKAQIWKAVWLNSESDLKDALKFPADALLVDASSNGKLGGTNSLSNWKLAERLARERKVILAGGISDENALRAYAQVGPYALDANSSLESPKYQKSLSKIKSFMEKTKKINTSGRYGIYGGTYVAETLMPALHELERVFYENCESEDFNKEYDYLLKNYVGRPSPLYYAKRLSDYCGGAKIWLKREDLNHTGAHKINNALGQALLAKRMGKTRLIAETGAGMHGVATATVAALFGFKCDVFMGSEDIARQAPNVDRMKMLGANLISVSSGTATLKDAMNEALRDWVATVNDTFYVIGTAAGPHPYPEMVKKFQSVIGSEAKKQSFEAFGKLPDEVIACVGGGSNSIGLFSAFIDESSVKITGVEAGGSGISTGLHAASLNAGSVGVLHGNKTYLLQDKFGQILNTHSVSAGLDYPGVGPEHAYLRDTKRATYEVINDDEAIEAFQILCRLEGIIPALESSHAVAQAIKNAKKYTNEQNIVVCLSGRGDKDMDSVQNYLNQRK